MNYRIVNGAVSYGANTVIEEINFEIKQNDKIAVIGRNGSGKSTLINALINNEMLEEGIGESKFTIYKQGIREIGYLKQIEFENTDNTLFEEILKVYKPIIYLENKIVDLENKVKIDSNEKNIKEYTSAMEKYELLGGYTYKKDIDVMISKFGFSLDDKLKKIKDFSGGQKTKIAFIKLLLSKPDLLFLDEPTNNLDIATIEWLECYLNNYPKAVVIVSHDRMFLDKIVNKVYEIEYGVLTEYTGNYSSFEVQKRMNYEKQLKDYEYQQKEIKRLQAIADRFRYKPTKAKMALSKLKKIEQMVRIEEPNKYDLKSFNTNFSVESKSGEKVLSVKELKIGYTNEIAKLSFELYRGDKLGIIGANGMGKSTLLKTLAFEIKKLGGEIEYGYNVKKEYFEQDFNFVDENRTVLEEFSECFPDLTIQETRSSLASFLFVGEEVNKKIKVLSGGEKNRLELCKCLKKRPNLLMLDEPTNHMDIVGKESLEYLLKNYEGTLIFVSHDRYFVNKIATCLIIFKDGFVRFFKGTYDEYLKTNVDNDILIEKVNTVTKKVSDNKEKYVLKKKISKLENEISNKEEKKNTIQEMMLSEEVCSDYIRLFELQNELQNLDNDIERLMNEWERLNEMLEK